MESKQDQLIDVWEVSPSMTSDFDCAVFECHIQAVEYVKELAELMIDMAGENDEFTIEIKHRSMTRYDYEEACG